MAYTDQELEIIKAGAKAGKSKEEVKSALIKYRSGYVPPPTQPTQAEKPLSNKITDSLGLGGAVDVFGSHLARMGLGPQTAEQGKESIEAPSAGQTAGALLQTAAIPAGFAVTGGTSLLGQMAAGAGVGYLFDVGSDLVAQKGAADTLLPGGGTVAGALIPPALRGLGSAFKGATGLTASLGKKAVEAIPVPEGIGQVAKEYAERIPRAFERGAESLEKAKLRAERIETATPEVREAIESKLDDVVIGAIEQADEPTKQAYRRMVEIAEAPRTGLRPSARPESVAGETASEQYKLLDGRRKAVGQKIGDAVDTLSKQKGKVDTLPAQRQMRDILRVNGIMPDISGQLNFTGTKFPDKQRAAIQRLYELATEGGENLTPRQIYNKDQLFSQLQREARFSEIGDIVIDVPEGSMSLFRAFRNIYANHLDEIAPEIKELNREYRTLKNLQDDVEGSIVKSGNFETTKNIDPAEFAQTNLRRLFSDAQSAADYRQIYENLDALSRNLGYSGPRADDLAGFAQRLRQVYPDTVPETSFQGGITGGIMNTLNKLMDIGAPNVTDQQKALRKLLGIPEKSSSGAGEALAVAPAVVDEDADASQELSLLGLAAMLSGRKAMHKEDQEFLTEFALGKDKSAKTVKLVRETMESYGLKVPQKTEDIKALLNMAMESKFAKDIAKKY